MEFEDNTFDGAYAFEATCHADDLVQVYREIFRVLKPGALFVDGAWSLTDSYDPNNPEHVKIVNDILVGCYDTRDTEKVIQACLRLQSFNLHTSIMPHNWSKVPGPSLLIFMN